MEGIFTLFAVGSENFLDAAEPTCDCLRFDDLSWKDVQELSAYCFAQGYPVAIWRRDSAQGGV